MSKGSTLKKFNPLDMSKEDVISLATGREKILAIMLDEMKECIHSKISQHYVLFGPRGIGKSFFIRLLKIHHDQSIDFAESIFIQLPEETDNIRYVADLMDKISNKLEGGYYVDTKPRWEMTEYIWSQSKKRLKAALQKIEEENKHHVFIGIENLQEFIPKLDDIENGRMREFLSDFYKITLVGSSLRPDLDSDYNKKLFQVFKKIDIEPWKSEDYIEFYQKKAELSSNPKEQQRQLDISENKIKAIAAFTGGSPRLAVILSNLVLDQKIIETAVLLDNIIDDLTAYYQDLIKDIPSKSKALFDMLIRIGENVTQSELAQSFNPPLEQKTIARSFNWLLENYYVVYKKQARGNTKHYYVRDRLFVLYYQKRQVFADQLTSFVGVFVEFLTEYFSQLEWKEQIKAMDLDHPYSKSILAYYSSRRGLVLDESRKSEKLPNNIVSDMESEYSKADKSKIEKRISKQLEDLMDEAQKFYKERDFELAIMNLKKAIEFKPDFAPAYVNLGISLKGTGDIESAIEFYKKAIEINPNFAISYFNLGLAFHEKGDVENAIAQYKMAIKLDANFKQAYNNLGVLFCSLEDWKESEYWLLQGLEREQYNLFLIHSLFELYIIQSKWFELSSHIETLPEKLTNGKLIGRALGDVMNQENIEPFLIFSETLNYIKEEYPNWIIGFIISLSMHLFSSDKRDLLETLVCELKLEENDNPFVKIILECWEYLLDPDNQDIAKLHPDARIVACKIIEMENMEKL